MCCLINHVPLTGTVALTWLSGLCVPVTPRAMPAGVFTPLVGPPKPERSRSRVQTKHSPTTLQMGRLGLRLTTPSCKKVFVTETATKTTNNLHADLPRSPNRMTVSGESRQETTGVKSEVMSSKTKRSGLVFGMYVGKLAQVTAEMRRYSLHVLGVSESRWIGTGRLKTVSGETVLYSGRDDELHREGVAIILKKGADRSLLEWKPINSRLIKAKTKQLNADSMLRSEK